MAFSPAGAGAAVKGGQTPTVTTVNLMRDPRRQLTLSEGLNQGVGKAHRQVVYCNYEFRNYRRSSALASAKV